ncbi:cupin domain-containing protein [Bacteroidales bacterium OttesenSCG-928-B11]|nr:cupin domain-containing protein [Bacteroidales bacterium OttesenSCG-928-E04]MDL2308153.1 cupin domain-containing protein [Bacteroidales bacterium OttesenSCG-928-C03]MDL2311492.1 cupin domain-containing protein [Bacteroidales bacterium OttesenSCG-928-B11]MDL2325579.1 cupin domain-containing protein [Bacteroidales bacterium OttesenSCG-928-A14]
MKIREVKQVEPLENMHNVDARRIYDTDSAQAVHMTLQAGQSLKPHTTPVDVFFYILEGTPDVSIGEKTITVGKDTIVESPKGTMHCLANNSEQQARILVVKAPRPGR